VCQKYQPSDQIEMEIPFSSKTASAWMQLDVSHSLFPFMELASSVGISSISLCPSGVLSGYVFNERNVLLQTSFVHTIPNRDRIILLSTSCVLDRATYCHERLP